MHTVALTWQQAAWLAGALLAVSVALQWSSARRAPALTPFAREAGYLAALYALWQVAGSQSVLGTQDAFARARSIVGAERDWHLPSEVRVQQLVLPHPLLVQMCNLYYASMHFTALFALLWWLFARHRDRYPQVRTTIVLLTAMCLAIQLIPVAPPRLLPQFGFVDTAEQYGQSVYRVFGAVGADQLSAMPSVHVGWAVLVALAVVQVARSPWRWLVVLHPLATVFVVTATANHFWLDGIVAVTLLAVALLLQRGAREFLTRLRSEPERGRDQPVPTPAA